MQHFILFSVVKVLTPHVHKGLLDFRLGFLRVKITTGSVRFTNIRKCHNIPLGWKGTVIIAILHLGNMLHMLELQVPWISFHERKKKPKTFIIQNRKAIIQKRQHHELLKPLSEVQ